MKWYIVVEGRQTEKRLYQAWLEHVFPQCARADRLEDMTDGRYYLLAGNGYPSYLRRIAGAVADIRDEPGRFDHLWICIDAEDATPPDLRARIGEIIVGRSCPVTHTIVVHDCCIETWLLGNRKLARRNPESERLRAYYQHYDVRTDDPEGLPAMVAGRTRAHFHLQYLQEMFRERGLSYTKLHPCEARDQPYLHQLVRRVDETGHLQSLRFLVEHWRSLGGQL